MLFNLFQAIHLYLYDNIKNIKLKKEKRNINENSRLL